LPQIYRIPELCCDSALATREEQLMVGKRLAERVVVRNFPVWCSEQIRQDHFALPPDGNGLFDQPVRNLGMTKEQLLLGESATHGAAEFAAASTGHRSRSDHPEDSPQEGRAGSVLDQSGPSSAAWQAKVAECKKPGKTSKACQGEIQKLPKDVA
jgi:hypothetical protein